MRSWFSDVGRIQHYIRFLDEILKGSIIGFSIEGYVGLGNKRIGS